MRTATTLHFSATALAVVAALLLLPIATAGYGGRSSAEPAPTAPSFIVANDAFVLDGAPIVLRSGSLHFHRLHPSQWADRVARMKAMGLNAIQMYVTWNWHASEFDPAVVDFTSPARNLSGFLAVAAQAEMLVLLRAGPYVCGETDGGGMPASLLTVPGLKYRTNNSAYLSYVNAWWAKLLPVLKPYLRAAGGPIAMVQLENEYGSYGNTGGVAADKAYMRHLRDMAVAALGPATTVQLYTTDGGECCVRGHSAVLHHGWN